MSNFPGKVLLAACLALGTPDFAQSTQAVELPDAAGVTPAPSPSVRPHGDVRFRKKIFWTFVAVDAASAVSDTQISRAGLQICQRSSEANSWLYGQKPGLGRYYATDIVLDGGADLLSYKALHSHHKPLHLLGWLPLAVMAGSHATGAIQWAKAINDNCKYNP